MTKKNLIVSIALFLKEINADGFKVWVQERLEVGPLFGLLEFPGGKIEDGETPETAARREVLEEVGIVIPADSPVILFKYQDYSHETKNICLFVFLSNYDQLPSVKGQWLEITYHLKSTPYQGKIPPINHVILDDLAVYLQSQYNSGMIGSIWQM
ncbi:MAG: NUDIX domain-containing protein [Bacteriovorax sp.]|nr:NUDIX domain-containing protein [Bacteriovorax sp.]